MCLTDFFSLLLNLVFSNREHDSKAGCVRFLHQNTGFDNLPLLWYSNLINFLTNSLLFVSLLMRNPSCNFFSSQFQSLWFWELLRLAFCMH